MSRQAARLPHMPDSSFHLARFLPHIPDRLFHAALFCTRRLPIGEKKERRREKELFVSPTRIWLLISKQQKEKLIMGVFAHPQTI